jgi:cysteine synthase A
MSLTVRAAPVGDPIDPADLASDSSVADLTAATGRVLSAYPRLRQAISTEVTPLVELPAPPGVRVLGKAEWHNPTGSVKDRTAIALVVDALDEHLRAGGDPAHPPELLEYSGGSLADSLVPLCAAVGAPLHVVLSDATPPAAVARLREHGVSVDLVDRDQGFIAVMARGLALAAAQPQWRLLYQHRNLSNVAVHVSRTGAELVAQLSELGVRPDVWVASIGSGGTLAGVAHALRRHWPGLPVVGVTPAELPYGSMLPPNGLPKYAGSGGLGHGICQPFVAALAPPIEFLTVSYDAAKLGMRELRDTTGLRIGSSAAANWLVSRQLGATLPAGSVVVTVLPSAGTDAEWDAVDRLG